MEFEIVKEYVGNKEIIKTIKENNCKYRIRKDAVKNT